MSLFQLNILLHDSLSLPIPCHSFILSLSVSVSGFPAGSVVKNLPANAGEVGSIPRLGRFPQEKEMATHSSILAWEIPWTEEPETIVHEVTKELDTA